MQCDALCTVYMYLQVMGWLTPYPDGLSRSQHAQAGTTPSAQWVETMGSQWQTVFLLTAVINVMGAAAYTVLGSGERQWWSPPASRGRGGGGGGGGGVQYAMAGPRGGSTQE